MSYISYVNKECKVIRKRSKKKGLIVALVIISAIIAGVVFFVVRNVNPVIEAISSEKIRAIATEAVSKSVLDIMSQIGRAHV